MHHGYKNTSPYRRVSCTLKSGSSTGDPTHTGNLGAAKVLCLACQHFKVDSRVHQIVIFHLHVANQNEINDQLKQYHTTAVCSIKQRITSDHQPRRCMCLYSNRRAATYACSVDIQDLKASMFVGQIDFHLHLEATYAQQNGGYINFRCVTVLGLWLGA